MPVAVLAIVLGPLAEQSFRQSLLMSQAEMSIFVNRPLSAMFLAFAVLLAAYPAISGFFKDRKKAKQS